MKIVSISLDSEKDKTTEQCVRDQDRADPKVDDEAFEERVVAGFIWDATETEAPHLGVLSLGRSRRLH